MDDAGHCWYFSLGRTVVVTFGFRMMWKATVYLFKIHRVFRVDKSRVAVEDVTHSEKVLQLLRKKMPQKIINMMNHEENMMFSEKALLCSWNIKGRKGRLKRKGFTQIASIKTELS